MGFFDFLKTKGEEKERVKLDELESWLKAKNKQNAEKEKELSEWIKQRTSQFVNELKSEIETMKNANLLKRDAKDKIEFIVKENMNHYISLLERLSDNLKSLDEKNLDLSIKKINFIFADFEKKSFMNFQKASFYFEKEIGDAKKSMSLFFRDLREILERNKSLIDLSRILSLLSSKLDKLKEHSNLNSQINRQIQEIERRKSDLKDRIESTEKNMQEIRESKEYAEKIKKREEAEKKKAGIRQEILKLKEEVDLKALARTFHENEKKMKIIREYNNDFYGAFENDGGLGLISLVDESRKVNISKKIEEIQGKKEEIIIPEKDEIGSLKEEKEKLGKEIEYLDNEKSGVLKKIQKLEEEKRELINTLKSELAKINVEMA
jgi:hypothetical protein